MHYLIDDLRSKGMGGSIRELQFLAKSISDEVNRPSISTDYIQERLETMRKICVAIDITADRIDRIREENR